MRARRYDETLEGHRPTIVLALLLTLIAAVLSGACASVGTGRPEVVKAEDVLTNSLSFYETAMQYHFANSTSESPAVYRAMETFRVKFKPAWNTLDTAIRDYKAGKPSDVSSAVSLLRAIVTDLQAVWTPTTGGK